MDFIATITDYVMPIAFGWGIYQGLKWLLQRYGSDVSRSQHPSSVAGSESLAEARSYSDNLNTMNIACLAKLAKIDGVVTKGEIAVVERIFDLTNLPSDERKQAIAIFQRAKAGKATLGSCAIIFKEMCQNDTETLVVFVLTLFRLAYAEGEPNKQTHEALVHVCRVVHLPYEGCAKLFDETRDESVPQKVQAAFTVLGCKPTDSHDAIRDKYRKLVKDFHPDTVISKNLAPEFVKFAEERFKQIQAAYETVTQARA